MANVHDNCRKFGFHGDFITGLIDISHSLIHLAHEDNYSQLSHKLTWYVDGCSMQVFKWMPSFNL